MDTFDTIDQNYSSATEPEIPSEPELDHSEKLTGIFTSPKATFEKMSHFPPRTIDWLLPVLLLLVLVVVSQFVMMSNENIYFNMKQQQIEKSRTFLQQMVDKGQISESQAEESMNRIQDQFSNGRTPGRMAIQAGSILIGGFIFFFIVSAIYFLFSKFALHGDGNFASALVPNGMVSYIVIIQVVIATILAFAFGRMLNDVSLASLFNLDKTTWTGFALAKLNIFTIWEYVVLSIGLAKMFKSQSIGKFYVMVFGLWIIWALLMFFVAKAVPFLSFLAG